MTTLIYFCLLVYLLVYLFLKHLTPYLALIPCLLLVVVPAQEGLGAQLKKKKLYFEPHYESEAKCKAFHMKITFHLYANKIPFVSPDFAPDLLQST